jgi:hypothetical protein
MFITCIYIVASLLNKIGLFCLQTFSTYEVATACALAIEADKLICVVDGQIFDEHGRVIHFMSLEEADMLIRKRAKLSDIAANYVKVVDEEEHEQPLNRRGHLNGYAPSFQNGLGFNNGNGIYSGEQGFAIGGEERLSRSNGYLSELAAAAYVCHVSVVPYIWHSSVKSSSGSRLLAFHRAYHVHLILLEIASSVKQHYCSEFASFVLGFLDQCCSVMLLCT